MQYLCPMPSRQDLIIAFERNKSLVDHFLDVYERYLSASNSWQSRAFPDSDMSNFAYFTTMKQVALKEYSAEQTAWIHHGEIAEGVWQEYINGLDRQYEALYGMHQQMLKKMEELKK